MDNSTVIHLVLSVFFPDVSLWRLSGFRGKPHLNNQALAALLSSLRNTPATLAESAERQYVLHMPLARSLMNMRRSISLSTDPWENHLAHRQSYRVPPNSEDHCSPEKVVQPKIPPPCRSYCFRLAVQLMWSTESKAQPMPNLNSVTLICSSTYLIHTSQGFCQWRPFYCKHKLGWRRNTVIR